MRLRRWVMSCAALFILASIAVPATAHNPHQDCTHIGGDPDIIEGSGVNDVCSGTAGRDKMIANGGRDDFSSGDGDDSVFGMGGGNAPNYEEVSGGKKDDDLSGGNGDDIVADNQSTDADRLCDGNGNDAIDMLDGDFSDIWYNEPDGQGEALVLRDEDGDDKDRIINNQSCPFTP